MSLHEALRRGPLRLPMQLAVPVLPPLLRTPATTIVTGLIAWLMTHGGLHPDEASATVTHVRRDVFSTLFNLNPPLPVKAPPRLQVS